MQDKGPSSIMKYNGFFLVYFTTRAWTSLAVSGAADEAQER